MDTDDLAIELAGIRRVWNYVTRLNLDSEGVPTLWLEWHADEKSQGQTMKWKYRNNIWVEV